MIDRIAAKAKYAKAEQSTSSIKLSDTSVQEMTLDTSSGGMHMYPQKTPSNTRTINHNASNHAIGKNIRRRKWICNAFKYTARIVPPKHLLFYWNYAIPHKSLSRTWRVLATYTLSSRRAKLKNAACRLVNYKIFSFNGTSIWLRNGDFLLINYIVTSSSKTKFYSMSGQMQYFCQN